MKELNEKLDHEEITNMQYITLQGQELIDEYKKWCSVFGFEEGDEDGTEQFINEIRYSDGADNENWPTEVIKEIDMNNNDKGEERQFTSMELFNNWKMDAKKLKALKISENAIRITLWRYQNPLGAKATCAKTLDITRNNVKKWWDVRYFIEGALADGAHVHPIRLEYEVIKHTILEAVEKAERSETIG